MKYLCMKSGTAQIVVSPNRDNIRFSVYKCLALNGLFQ
jgi:hypothetical protein